MNKKAASVSIRVPEDTNFADLKLVRDANGEVSFEWLPIKKICDASNIPFEVFKDGPINNALSLIMGWYDIHIQAGGERNAALDDIWAEARIYFQRGQSIIPDSGNA